MAEIWPQALPCGFIGGTMNHQLADTTLRSDTDTGPGKTRPRSSAGVEPLSGQMALTTEQWATLSQFYKGTLRGGALPFSFPLIGYMPAPLVLFREPPQRRRAGANAWIATIELVILP